MRGRPPAAPKSYIHPASDFVCTQMLLQELYISPRRGVLNYGQPAGYIALDFVHCTRTKERTLTVRRAYI